MKNFYWTISLLALVAAIYFLFIPAFAGTLAINPVIEVGAFHIRWYGLTMALAIFVAYLVSRHHSWRFGISKTDIDEYTFWVVIVGLIGARAYHVLFNLSYYSADWTESYKVWHGGISIYGALLAGLIFTYFYTRKKAYSFSQLFDVVALGLPLGQAVGRLGNFFNHEAFGLPTNLPWKMYVPAQYRPGQFLQDSFFHPAFLYEIIVNLAIFFMLQRLVGKTKAGTLGWVYLGLYSLGRFFIEGIRLDAMFWQGFRANQVAAVLLLVVSGIVILKKQGKT